MQFITKEPSHDDTGMAMFATYEWSGRWGKTLLVLVSEKIICWFDYKPNYCCKTAATGELGEEKVLLHGKSKGIIACVK
jgi:hypothetical protein